MSAIVARALAVSPELRFRSMDDLAAELEPCLSEAGRPRMAGPGLADPVPTATITTTPASEVTRRDALAPVAPARPRGHARVFVTALLAVPLFSLVAGGIYLAVPRTRAIPTTAAPAPSAIAPSEAGAPAAPSATTDVGAPPSTTTDADAPAAPSQSAATADARAPRAAPSSATLCGRFRSATVNAIDIAEAGALRGRWESAMAGPLLACARGGADAYCKDTTWRIAVTIEDRGAGVRGFVDSLMPSDGDPPFDEKLIRCVAGAIATQAPPPKNSPRYGGWLVVRFGT